MLENKILLDIEINKRCLDYIKEDGNTPIKRLLELWLKYDYELLALVKEDDVNEWWNKRNIR